MGRCQVNLAEQFNPTPKPGKSVRIEPKRGVSGKFSTKTIQTIGDRDEWLCVRCRSPYIESVPHHAIFKSHLGKGTVDNGVTICRSCHDWAHGKRNGPDNEPANEGRKWFEDYRNKYLLLEEAK
jgi:hypothetical protein